MDGEINSVEDLELVNLSEEDVIESDVKLIESTNPYVLGTIEGIFMVIEDDNGNGRWYQKDTILKGIIENDYVVRMLVCKALLGEAHHPLDRTSIWLDEACICTRELWIDSTGKYLMGRADILDTPKGRIVYTLCKYGTKIGISARANGKGVKQGKHLVIKPEHYFFKTFDVVLNPGFKEARPAVFENDGRTPMKIYEECENPEEMLFEELKTMITNNSCDKKMVKNYIEYCDSAKLKELMPLMEDASTEPSEGDTSTSNDTNEKLMEEINELKAKLEASEAANRKAETVKANYESEINELRAVNEEQLEVINLMNEDVNSYDNSEAETIVEELMTTIQSKQKEIEKCNQIIKLFEENNLELSEKVKTLENEKENLENSVRNLTESVQEYDAILEEVEVEEQVVEKPQKLFNNKVSLFNSTSATLNEEQSVNKSVSNNNNRINMIKTLGGK